jgi:hypothetical protein
MRRRTLFVALGIVVVLVIAAGVVVLTTQPDLDDAQEHVDTRWTPLRKPLQVRNQALAIVEQAVTAAGGEQRAVVQELRPVFDRWAKLAGEPNRDADAGAEAETANELEALGARLRANITVSERLKNVQAVRDALALYDGALVPQPLVVAYNRAVRRYQELRDGTLESVVAAVFGYDARPTFVIGV